MVLEFEEALKITIREWEENPQRAVDEKEVIKKYGDLFHPENLDKITSEDFLGFLNFKNNRHWSNLARIGPLLTKDMAKLRKSLKILLDENIPIDQRLKRIRDKNSPDYHGLLGPAIYTPILLVVYPKKYPVINKTVKTALDKLNIYKRFDSKPQWISYPEVQEKILELAKTNNFSLWQMDWFWWKIAKREERDKPIGLCWSTDDLAKLEEFQKIIKNKDKMYWGVNWSATKLQYDDYPLTGFLNYKRNIVAKGIINKIISDRAFQNIPDKSEYRIPQGEIKPGNWKYYVEFSSLEKIDDPFPTKNLQLYFSPNKPIPSNLQNKVYVVDLEEGTPGKPEERINYWIVKTGRETFDWPNQRDNGFTGIHYFDTGPLTQFYDQNGNLSKENKSKLRKALDNPKFTTTFKGRNKEAKISQALIQFNAFMQMKKNDKIIAYGGQSKIMGVGTISGSYQYKPKLTHCHTCPVTWEDTHERIAKSPVTRVGTVLPISKEKFEALIGEKPFPQVMQSVTSAEFDEYFDILERKKQLIIYGPPGTGKTFIADKVAKAWISENPSQDKQYIRKVTFHPSYSYEEFVEGIKPKPKGQTLEYPVEPGIFKTICEEARNDDSKTRYVLFIDEINRGNISKIFGELITLIENDKRDAHSLQLAYSREPFSVPQNVYIIGTMNTADRSLIQIDAALRRRFGFSELMPKPELLPQKIEGVSLRELLEKLNERITAEGLREKQIGHSYLMPVQNLKDLQFAFANEIVPLLQDYFYDDYKKLEEEILSSDFIDSEKMVVKDNWKKDPKVFLSAIKKTFQI